MTPEQIVVVIEVMDTVGAEAVLNIEHNDDHVMMALDEDRAIKIWDDGGQFWFQHGEFHRDNSPTVIQADGSQLWHYHGLLHREDGPADVRTNGQQRWYHHGRYHRNDGPAVIEADGSQHWYQHGERHRDDGPAAIWVDGRQEWWLNKVPMLEAEHARLTGRT